MVLLCTKSGKAMSKIASKWPSRPWKWPRSPRSNLVFALPWCFMVPNLVRLPQIFLQILSRNHLAYVCLYNTITYENIPILSIKSWRIKRRIAESHLITCTTHEKLNTTLAVGPNALWRVIQAMVISHFSGLRQCLIRRSAKHCNQLSAQNPECCS